MSRAGRRRYLPASTVGAADGEFLADCRQFTTAVIMIPGRTVLLLFFFGMRMNSLGDQSPPAIRVVGTEDRAH